MKRDLLIERERGFVHDRRHDQKKLPAWEKMFLDIRESVRRVVEMLENIGRNDDVKITESRRHVLCVSQHELQAGNGIVSASVLDRTGVLVNSQDFARACLQKMSRAIPRAASNIQNPPAWSELSKEPVNREMRLEKIVRDLLGDI